MPLTNAPFMRPRTARAGFSLVELMITLVLLAVVVAVIATVVIGSQRSKADTEGRIEAQQSGRAISDIIAQDIRTAGYGTDNNTIPNQTPFAYVDSVEIQINVNQQFPDTSNAPASATNPYALDPAAAPLPARLTGAYLPATTYATHAETVVYTLDLNNDGNIDATDQAQGIATEAQRTPNPNDYVLGRVVYGRVAAGNNGGSVQKVGLVRGPGAGIPPMYSVYLNGSATPWDWHNGAVPANRLKDITSIRLQITTEGRRPRSDGTFPRATLTTEINSIRNAPNVATSLNYHVTGYVFNDVNPKDQIKNGSDVGLAGVVLQLGTAATVQTSSTGYFDISGPQAQYILKQLVPAGYYASTPDSFAVNFVSNPADVVHNFADTTRVGGWVDDTCYVDVNSNNVLDAGDIRVDGATISSNGQSCITGADGGSAIFVPVGTQPIAIAPPDSFMVTSTNPVSLAITNGSTNVIYTKLAQNGTGNVTGYVFLDSNKNGTKDVGETTGIPGAWVGVTANGGTTVEGYAYTDASGYYSVVVPNNMPAATTVYTVSVVPPNAYYPTGTTAIGSLWVTTGQTLSNNNFGMVNFTSFSLFADRVLALGTANLLEKDWSGNDNNYDTKGSYDEDLILCSEYVSNPNISVWFNHESENHAQVFDSTFTYQVNAQTSALCIATGSIDTAVVFDREDAVTGLAYKASGNIAVWLTQNSPTASLGYFVTTPQLYSTADGGDVQQVKLQDCAGGSALDLIVGTKSPTAYHGTIEIWRGNGAGQFARDEIYPGNGSLPGNTLGEVKALALSDVTGDGNKDLIIGTRTGDGTGKLHIMGYHTKVNGNRYTSLNAYDVVGEVTSAVATDVDQDGKMDIVLGTRLSSSTGNVQYWRGNGSGGFTLTATFVAPGPVLCLAAADLGGTSRNDIIYGFRTNESVFTGGVRILYTDLGTLPLFDDDPAGGTSNYMTTSIAPWNFNYMINPTTPGPYYTDMVIAQKPTATTGRLFIYQR